MEKLNQRETKYLEFKENKTSTYLKTVSAYANYEGGKIIFGMTDDGEEKGIKNPKEFCLDIENTINDTLDPVPDFSLSVQGNLVILEVKTGIYKPYYYKNKAYKRNDTSTVEVDRLELNQLILQGTNISYDETPSINHNLSFDILKTQVEEVLKIDSFDENILKTMGLISTSGTYVKAAELFADTNSFPGVDIIKFGNSDDEIYERVIVEKVSVLTLLDNSYSVFKKYYTFEKIENEYRTIIEKIPVKAFREAIANAIVHRNWEINANIQISMYDDYIKIVSPGGLIPGITEEEFQEGKFSILRNPILGDVLCRLRIIEKFGTGIKRIKNSYRELPVQPEFNITVNSISVKLPVCNKPTYFTDSEQEMMQKLQKGRFYSRVEIEQETGFNKDKVIRIIKTLSDKGKIEKNGEGKSSKYLIKK